MIKYIYSINCSTYVLFWFAVSSFADVFFEIIVLTKGEKYLILKCYSIGQKRGTE